MSEKVTQKSSQRYELLDLLRGFLLFIIIIDHVRLFPNIFEVFSGRGLLWVSAAEGFFFLSGMMVVIARLKHRDQKSLQINRSKILKRAAVLYALSFVLTVVYTIAARLLQENSSLIFKSGLDVTASNVSIIFRAATLQYSYGWADFLPFYTVYMALAVPLSVLVVKRKALLIVPLAIIPWLIVWLTHATEHWTQWFVWFAYFSLGLVAGAYIEELKKAGKWLIDRRIMLAGLGFIFVVITLTSYAVLLRPEWFSVGFEHFVERWLKSNRTGILRLPVFLVWSSFLTSAIYLLHAKIPRYIHTMLLTFGKSSLQNYLLQSVVIFCIPFIHFIPYNFVFNSMTTLAVIMVIYYLQKQRWVQRYVPV